MAVLNGAKRRQFTLSVLPETRDRLRRWAFEHDVTASNVVERLTAEYLDRLDTDTDGKPAA